MNISLGLIISAISLVSLSAQAGSVSGGVADGGGGGLMNPPAATHKQIRELVLGSRAIIHGYLFGRENIYRRNLKDKVPASTLDQKLFAGAKSIYDALSTAIDLREALPCNDRNGDEVDGSDLGKAADSICISSQRIVLKVDQNSADYHVPGLILHELSHRLGATEQEAIELQADYIQKNFRKMPLQFRALGSQQSDVWNAREAIDFIEQSLGNSDFRCTQSEYFASSFHTLKRTESLSLYINQNDLKWLGPQAADLYVAHTTKINAAVERICALDSSNSPQARQMYQDRYLRGFAGATQMDANQYYVNLYGIGQEYGLGLASSTINLCADNTCLLGEMAEIKSALMNNLIMLGKIAEARFQIL